MKFFTPSLLKYTLIASILTLVFQVLLSWTLDNFNYYPFIVLIGISYGLLMFATAYILGKKEADNLPIYGLAMKYHDSTFVIFFCIYMLWVYFGYPAAFQKDSGIPLFLEIWFFVLLIHSIIYSIGKKKTIKGLDKEELFD